MILKVSREEGSGRGRWVDRGMPSQADREGGTVGERDAERLSGLEMMCVESSEITLAGVESPDSYSSRGLQQAPHSFQFSKFR